MRIFAIVCGLMAAAPGALAQWQVVTSFEDDSHVALLRPRNTRVEVVEQGATDGGRALRVEFDPVQWPALWFAPAEAFDLREYGEILLDVTNPMDEPLTFRLRVDDDPRADGSNHSRTGGATIAPGETATFSFPLKQASGAQYGMKGLPAWPGSRSMGSAGFWNLNVGNIVAFQIFMASPGTRKVLLVDNVRFGPAPPLDGIVDPFGQYAHAEWPGKVYSTEELQARREEERAQLEAEAATWTDRDRFGGWAEGPRREGTGFFRAEKVDGKWWLVTPDGTLFFSTGLDGIRPVEYTFITKRESMFSWLPEEGDPLRKYVQPVSGAVEGPVREGMAINWYGLNIERKFGGPDPFEAWAEAALLRLRAWGFNTIANWSDARLFRREVPYVIAAGIGGTHNRIVVNVPSAGATMHDPFDPRFAVNVRNSLRAQAEAAAGDPYCIGYFVDNELSWGNRDTDRNRYAIATGALAQAYAQSPAKRAFVGMLQGRYGSLAELNRAWGTAFAAWENVQAPGLTAAVAADYSAFVKEHARQYFRVVREELKALDPDHLYLGSRFAWYTPEAAAACAEYCDVVSFNVYQRRIERAGWAFLEALDRPAIIGEFHFGALDRGMFHGGLQAAMSQEERGRFYREYVRSVADHPNFVGCHWFLASDQPLTGRTRDGENYNVGFVSIADAPYPEMVEAARGVHGEVYGRRGGVGAVTGVRRR